MTYYQESITRTFAYKLPQIESGIIFWRSITDYWLQTSAAGDNMFVLQDFLICWLIIPNFQADCDIRDYGKKVQNLEIAFDETNDKLTKATESLEEKEKMYKEVEADVSALTRRIMLMEEEAKKSEQTLADTVTR